MLEKKPSSTCRPWKIRSADSQRMLQCVTLQHIPEILNLRYPFLEQIGTFTETLIEAILILSPSRTDRVRTHGASPAVCSVNVGFRAYGLTRLNYELSMCVVNHRNERALTTYTDALLRPLRNTTL